MNSLTPRRTMILIAWAVMLVVSDLPDILIATLGGSIPPWILWAKAGFLAAFLALTLAWKFVRPLWQYAMVFLVLYLSLNLTGLVRNTGWFQSSFNYKGVSFITGYAAIFVLDIIVALLVLAALWLMKHDRRTFFLVRGQVDAPIEPVRWLGIKQVNLGKHSAGSLPRLPHWLLLYQASSASLLRVGRSKSVAPPACRPAPGGCQRLHRGSLLPLFFAFHPARDYRQDPHATLDRGLLRSGALAVRLAARVARLCFGRLPGLAAWQSHAGDQGLPMALVHPFRSRCGDILFVRALIRTVVTWHTRLFGILFILAFEAVQM